MSRPRHMAPTADHAPHNALLVAQLAAGDPLEQAQRDEAVALVSACSECAALAADLRTLATAVAWEPTPPRRRDFRLSPAQAEHARGSALQRFMRRLAMPRSNGLRPLAAGVMSLGLLLVLAGNLWPDEVYDASISQEVAAPAAVAGPSGDPSAETRAAGTPEHQGLTLESEASLSSPAARAEEGVDGFADDVSRSDLRLQAADELDQDLVSKASAAAAAEAVSDVAGEAPDASTLPAALAPSINQYDAADGPPGLDTLAAVESGPAASVSPTAAGRVAGDAGEVDETADGIGSASGNAMPADSDASVNVGDDGISVDSVLVLVGAGLLVGGFLLWLLVWVARRRSPDPLAP